MYVDDFLDEATLKSLQDTVTKLEYQEVKNPEGQLYGMRHTFDTSIHNDPLIKLIKQYFFPHRNLEPISVSAHLRENNKEPLVSGEEGLEAVKIIEAAVSSLKYESIVKI